MAKFCRYCGIPLPENSRFCVSCGKSQAKSQPQQAVAQQNVLWQATPQQAVLRQSATQQTVPWQTDLIKPTPQQNPHQEATPIQAKTISGAAVEPKTGSRQTILPQLFTQPASATIGELGCREFGLMGQAGEAGSGILSPVKGLLQGVGSFFGGILSAFKKPSALIGMGVMAVLWFVLGSLRNADVLPVKLLSWLSFAEGGLDRSVPGALGGILGKGTVAAAFISLFTGGLKNAGKGVSALFKGRGEKRSLVGILVGALLGVGLYFVFTGPRASGSSTMAGIAGALLSLEALGSGRGGLYKLTEALTSKAQNGVRTAVQDRCDGLFTGLTAGFALGAVLFSLI